MVLLPVRAFEKVGVFVRGFVLREAASADRLRRTLLIVVVILLTHHRTRSHKKAIVWC